MNVWTFWVFVVVFRLKPCCYSNHHAKVEIDMLCLTRYICNFGRIDLKCRQKEQTSVLNVENGFFANKLL